MWMHMHAHGHQMVSRVYDCLEDIQPGLSHKVVGGAVASAALSYVAVRCYRYQQSRRVMRERGEYARNACSNLREYLEERELEEGTVDQQKEARIVTLSLRELREKLRKGELTAMEVLRAFQRKALEVSSRLNCVTEPIFEAEVMAVDCDLCAPNQRGPLHGVPVSIKDSLFLEGYDCHGGLSFFVDKPVERDADIVQLLKNLGAVPFVRTNFPQALMTFCFTSYACSNPMYGRTVNPHNVLRGPGGSSGGEGALIGGGGSVIGFGSDIGGSIRIPCQMCGVYGLKPTVDRIVNKGHIPLHMGQTLVRVTVGPMARDMDSLLLLSEEIFTPRMHQLDPTVPPMYFSDELFERKGQLCVGYYTTLEGATPHPACVRAVMEAKAALERRGYKVVEFKPPRPLEAVCDLFMKACFADDGEEANRYMKDDVLDECVHFSYYAGGLPLWLQYLSARLMGFVDPFLSKVMLAVCSIPRKIIDWWDLENQIQAYKAEFLEAWKRQKLDAVLCPGLPFPAVTSGQEDNTLAGVTYTTLYNLLNYPVGILPVSTVTEEDIQRLRDPSLFPPRSSFERFLVKDAEGSVGLPVAVQCVALPFQEELVLRVMRDIDTTLRLS